MAVKDSEGAVLVQSQNEEKKYKDGVGGQHWDWVETEWPVFFVSIKAQQEGLQ